MRGPVAALLALALLPACRVPPARGHDGVQPARDGAGDGGPRARVIFDRGLGAEGEQPRALLAADVGELLALSDRARYRLDADGRVLERTAIDGELLSAAWDGARLGLTLRRLGAAGGIVFSLLEAGGAATETAVAGAEAEARGVFDGARHHVVYTEASAASLELRLRSLPEGSARTLASGLPATSALGALAARAPGELALCTLEPGGEARLRRFTLAAATVSAAPPLSVGEPGRVATGTCALAASERALLAATRTRALAPGQVDLGTRAADLALGALAFDVPVARAVSAAGVVGETARLSREDGTVRLESLLWDGARFVALTLAAGVAGGRMRLTLLDEAGRVLARDLPLPLEYEPGSLGSARLVARPDAGDYLLFYSSRRPWDEGILHLVRFRLDG